MANNDFVSGLSERVVSHDQLPRTLVSKFKFARLNCYWNANIRLDCDGSLVASAASFKKSDLAEFGEVIDRDILNLCGYHQQE